jgi:hypothetical protein
MTKKYQPPTFNAAWALARAVESHVKEERLLDAFQAIRDAYFEEYTDAVELDSRTERAMRHIFDLCFPSGTNDGKDFDQAVLGVAPDEET